MDRFSDPGFLRRQMETPYASELQAQKERLLYRAQAPGLMGIAGTDDELFNEYVKWDLSVVDGLDKPMLGEMTALRKSELLLAEAYGGRDASIVTTGASGVAKAGTGMQEAEGRHKDSPVDGGRQISVG